MENTPKRIKYKGQEYRLCESKALKEAHISDDDVEVVAMIASDAEESAHELVDKLDRLLREAYALFDDDVVIDEVEDAITAIEELERFLSNESWIRYLSVDDDYDESFEDTKLNESSGMRKYTQRELRDMIRTGMAKELTSFADAPKDFDKIGYSSGTYGINGGLIQDRGTGEFYVIPDRSSLLLRIF